MRIANNPSVVTSKAVARRTGRVNELIKEGSLTQVKAAALFGIPQPHISELKHYRLNRFSSERLMHFMTLLDRQSLPTPLDED